MGAANAVEANNARTTSKDTIFFMKRPPKESYRGKSLLRLFSLVFRQRRFFSDRLASRSVALFSLECGLFSDACQQFLGKFGDILVQT
jgi:hypothetical protein